MSARGGFATLLASALLVGVTTARAGDEPSAADKKEAQTLFTQGLKLAAAGDQQGALDAFRSAYVKLPNYRVLYNIGRICSQLDDPACAVRSFEQYLREGGAAIAPKRRKEIETELESLRASVATIGVTVDEPDSEVSIDDTVVGRAPLSGPYAVNPGSHTIVATYEERTVSRTVKLQAGDTVSVDLELPKPQPDAPPEPEPEPEPEPAPAPPPPRSVPVAPWIVTGGLAVGTLVTGVLAAGSYSTFQDKKDAFPVTRAELDDAQGSARTLFLVTGILGACTIVSAGIASYFTLRPPARRSPAPSVGIGPRGVVLSGSLP